VAFIMAFEDPSGILHPESYWRLDDLHLDRRNRQAYATFRGYRDRAAFEAGKLPIAGAERGYPVGGQDFDRMMTDHLAPGGPNIAEQAYVHARAFKDEPDEAGGFRSFFADAEDA
jgi:hypothetical protein